jgi:hypothetical protein
MVDVKRVARDEHQSRKRATRFFDDALISRGDG